MSEEFPTEEIPLAAGEHPPVPGAIKVSSDDRADRHLTTRTKARKAALDILFEADLLERSPISGLSYRVLDPEVTVRELTRDIVEGYAAHQEEIDQQLAGLLLGNWTIDRMPRIDRNLARIALWELKYTDTAPKVIISEALELADDLSTDDSVNYLNGILGRALQDHPLGG